MSKEALLPNQALAVVLGLFVCSALYRGGNDSVIVLAAGCVAALALVFLGVRAIISLESPTASRAAVAALLALLVIALCGAVGQVSLPAQQWLTLPGRDGYQVATDWLAATSQQSQRYTLSIDAHRAALASLVAVAAIACVSIAHLLPLPLARRVLALLACLVITEAVLGLLQLALGSPSFLAYGAAVGNHRATGTFVNKNHYATLLAMILPLLIMRSAGQFRFGSPGHRSGALADTWWAVATAVVAAALVSSLSRAGVAAASVAALLTIILCARNAHSKQERVTLVVAAAFAILMSALAGFGLLLKTLAGPEFLDSISGRNLIYSTTWEAALQLFPVGGGLGSFALAFPRYQPSALSGYVEYAHNDYLQLLFELGAVGIAVLALFGSAAALTVANLTRAGRSNPSAWTSPAAACALGCLPFSIHAWFDFPSHIPAVAWTACVLAGFATRIDLLRSATPRIDSAEVPSHHSRRSSAQHTAARA